MKVRIIIMLKNGVLDTQGKAIEGAINKNLGFEEISDVRQGKVIELNINEDSQAKAQEIIDKVCDKLLVNQVIEDYKFEIID